MTTIIKEPPNLFITITFLGKQTNPSFFVEVDGNVDIENLLEEAGFLVEHFIKTAVEKQ